MERLATFLPFPAKPAMGRRGATDGKTHADRTVGVYASYFLMASS